MKKTYVKPAMAVEMFTLTQTVAMYCGAPGGTSNHWSQATCSYSLYGDNLWTLGAGIGCDEDGNISTTDCYNTSAEILGAFSS